METLWGWTETYLGKLVSQDDISAFFYGIEMNFYLAYLHSSQSRPTCK